MNETCSLEEVLKIWQLPFPGKDISQEKQPRDHWAGCRGSGGVVPAAPTSPQYFGMIPMDPKTTFFIFFKIF